MNTIETAAVSVGHSYARVINQQNRLAVKNGIGSSYHQVRAREAFLAVHGGPVSFVGVNDDPGFLGERTSLGTITVHLGQRAYISQMWTMHELGHDFNAHAIRPGNDYGQPYVDLRVQGIRVGDQIIAGNFNPDDYLSDLTYLRKGRGYHGEVLPWVQNDAHTAGEDFADMFANWVSGSFPTDPNGSARNNWVESHMPGWISLTVSFNE